jgi:hypothetical protein
MSVDIRATLQAHLDELNKLYAEHLHAVQDLQTVLISDILPGLADELGWDSDHVQYARDWLGDTGMCQTASAPIAFVLTSQ